GPARALLDAARELRRGPRRHAARPPREPDCALRRGRARLGPLRRRLRDSPPRPLGARARPLRLGGGGPPAHRHAGGDLRHPGARAPGARVGLTGPNGAGKSTLLRIIAGEVEPDRGTVALPRGARVGYLPQHILGTRGVTVHRHALAAFADLHELEARRASLEHALATVAPESAEYPAVMERYRAVCEEWDHRGRYDTEAEAEAVLAGLGFRAADMERDCGELSGGWQMRAALAQLLLRRPDFLLLDEPTNYLDLE